MPEGYDVAVIGAGVVGAAIARELARYQLDVALVEAGEDVGAGTSKANTSLLHTGFDAKPGSLEARLVSRGHELLGAYAKEAGIPLERSGAILVAWADDQVAKLPDIEANSRRNGYLRAKRLSPDEVYRAEPHLGPGALGGLEIPDESIICAFTTPLALATQAVLNGVRLILDSRVIGRESSGAGLQNLSLETGALVSARYVVNAAGLYSDEINRLFGHDEFTVVPRRGELVVFDKQSRGLLSHIILPVPTAKTKGMLVAPTVYGNVMVGPTADDIEDKHATESTPLGIRALMERAGTLLPELADEEVTAVYAGLRAATEHSDYQIHLHPEERYVCVGGIRSTGLSASMAIAEHVVGLLSEAGLRLSEKPRFETVRMPNIGEAFTRPYQDAAMISGNPSYGRIVCHCERVTLGEIEDACRSTLPARSLDGLRRRTRACMGRCQGFYCSARLIELIARETGRSAGALVGMDRP